MARDRLLFTHTNLCLQIVQQAVMQKPSGMGVNGLCCVCLSHLVIQSFHSACFTARGLWKEKTLLVWLCFYTAGKMSFRLFWHYYYHCKNCVYYLRCIFTVFLLKLFCELNVITLYYCVQFEGFFFVFVFFFWLGSCTFKFYLFSSSLEAYLVTLYYIYMD